MSTGETDAIAFAVPALDRSLDVIEQLHLHPDGCSTAELSGHLRMPRASLFRIIATLVRRGYVWRDPTTQRVGLTRKFLELGMPRMPTVLLGEAAGVPMRTARDAIGETILIGVLAGEEGVLLDQVRGRHPFILSCDPGLRFPLHDCAPGKVLLACAEPAERTRRLRRLELSPTTVHTITDRRRFAAELDQVLAQGFAIDRQENLLGCHCVAVPVGLPDQPPIAAIWASGPTSRMVEADFPRVAEVLKAAAADMLHRLGLAPPAAAQQRSDLDPTSVLAQAG
ncbi:IclR family transcriptional regulator [Planctomycetota bacterium]|nr:IclR family transcriptional regulator [Planctomycetota bacterium]